MLFDLIVGLKPVAGLLIHYLVLNCGQYLLILVLRAYGRYGHHEETASLLLDGSLSLYLARVATVSLGRGRATVGTHLELELLLNALLLSQCSEMLFLVFEEVLTEVADLVFLDNASCYKQTSEYVAYVYH